MGLLYLYRCDIPSILCDNTMYCTQWTWLQDKPLVLKVKVLLSRGKCEVVIYSWTNVKPSFYCEKNQESKYKYELTPGTFARIMWPWTRDKYQILWLCVCILVFVILYAMRIYSASYFIVIFGLSGCTILFHMRIERHDFRRETVIEYKIVFWFSLQILLESCKT
jgi:hypothetical protein